MFQAASDEYRYDNMNGVSRHIACVLCRDRKVRCNGEQPACEKCRQAGEKCVYLPTCRPNKADLAQKLDTLQQRLGRFLQLHVAPVCALLYVGGRTR
jgi:hypothetical protein